MPAWWIYFFPATGAQSTAGASFYGTMTAITSAIMSVCLARYGFRQESLTAASAASLSGDNADFPDLPRISRTGVFGTGVLTAAQGPPMGLPAARQQAYQSDRSRCAEAAMRPFRPLTQAAGPLSASWKDVVSQVESAAPVRATLAGYRACMEAHGAPAATVTASSSASSFGFFLAWETGQETQAAGRSGEMAVDRHWAPIFVSCARPTVTAQDRLMPARRAMFLHEHDQQVLALAALAEREVAAARRQYGAPGTR